MAVHAHPDDECFGGGGTLARYAAEGCNTVLVTCTAGEEGEIVDPDMDPAAVKPRLADVRLGELNAAVGVLGIHHLELLGYRDSGMAGTPANDDPRSFNQADPDEATRRLVALIRRHKPQVLFTYAEDGGYGHPDHIKAHQITVAAFDAAGAHRTQIKRDSTFLLLPDDVVQEYLGVEGFRRAQTRVAAPDREDDLFAGLRSPAPVSR